RQNRGSRRFAMRKLLVLLVLLLAPGPLRADFLPNGKWIDHDLQIDNLKDIADYVLFAYPLHKDFERAAVELKEGKPVSIFGATGKMRLYAVPKRLYDEAKGKPQEPWFDGKNSDVLQSDTRIPWYSSTDQSDRTARVVTHFDAAIKDGKLT